MNNDILLEVSQICKSFGPTVALNKVNLKIRSGEIRGLIGENGSGKSTLTSIIAGMQAADSGTMSYLNKEYCPHSMVEAQHKGISMILQETGTISNISVAQNIFLGNENAYTKLGLVEKKRMNKDAQECLDRFGVENVKAGDNINRYSFEERKLIEVVRALKDETNIFIVDETTTALSHDGRELLYKLIRDMAAEGKAVIFISHDIQELIDVCNVLSVLRDGALVGELNQNEMDKSVIRKMMVGRDIGNKYYRADFEGTYSPEVVLKIENVKRGQLDDFDLELHKGEILGIGGLSGSGMHDVGRLAFGLDKPDSGRVMCGEKEVKDAYAAINMGIGYISKNRDQDALILQGSVKDNLVLPSLPIMEKMHFISPIKEKQLAQGEIENLNIKTSGMNQPVSQLSGGNKQKVSFGKWTARGSDILIMDCPTRGVDVGVKQAMYQLIENLKSEGKAILLISEELTELVGMSDRILIMKDFKISKEFKRSAKLSDRDIIEYMI